MSTDAVTQDEQDVDTAPETVQEDAATTERRASVKPADAIFHAPFEFAPPPRQVSARTYVPTAYDEIMQQMWTRYQEAGSPAWSLSGTWTREDRPADGWWADRDDIWATTVVPDVVNAESLIRRAAVHIGCSYRFKLVRQNGAPVEEDGGGFRIWFTAAPVLKQGAKTKDEETS